MATIVNEDIRVVSPLGISMKHRTDDTNLDPGTVNHDDPPEGAADGDRTTLADCIKRLCADPGDSEILDLTVSIPNDYSTKTVVTQSSACTSRAVHMDAKSRSSTPSPPPTSPRLTGYPTLANLNGLDIANGQQSWYPALSAHLLHMRPLLPPAYESHTIDPSKIDDPLSDVTTNVNCSSGLTGSYHLNGLPLVSSISPPAVNVLPLTIASAFPMASPDCTSSPKVNFKDQTSQEPLNLNFNGNLGNPTFPWSHIHSDSDYSPSVLTSTLLSQFSEAMGICNSFNRRSPAVSQSSSDVKSSTEMVSVKPELNAHDLFQTSLMSQSGWFPSGGQPAPSSPPSTFVNIGTPESITNYGFSDFLAPMGFDDSTDDHPTPRSVSNPIRKYSSYEECGLPRCQSSALREHYHCKCCNKVILRREEMIRHAKWHRKREESLQYGFMRYSPGDNCSVVECVHNGRQTHYHCLKPNCTKVYISTSDVQMHANFHRKDEVIIQEGFQRFRASESCGIPNCPFNLERTTHFHCRRRNCHFTFKNKADMEKHKSHHQKNDNFAKDGFRKYIKCETCGFKSCKYSGIINHIHCVRPGCDYVVHSSSQILSHKRKHDRRSTHPISRALDSTYSYSLDTSSFDSPYDLSKRPKSEPGMELQPETPPHCGMDLSEHGSQLGLKNEPDRPASCDGTSTNDSSDKTDRPIDSTSIASGGELLVDHVVDADLFRELSRLVTRCIQRRKRDQFSGEGKHYSSNGLCNCDSTESDLSGFTIGNLFARHDEIVNEPDENTEVDRICNLVNGCSRSSGTDSSQDVNLLPADNRNKSCNWPGCSSADGNDAIGEPGEHHQQYCRHWTKHVWQAALICRGYVYCNTSDCADAYSSHLHCYFWPVCEFTTCVDSTNFQVLYSHLIQHDSRLSCDNSEALETMMDMRSVNSSVVKRPPVYTSGGHFTPRRRGRPPKYAKYVRVPRPNVSDEMCKDNPHVTEIKRTMFFETPENDELGDNLPLTASQIVCGVKLFTTGEACPDNLCHYSNQGVEHYHCVRPRCFMASDNLDLMNVHRREFHNHISIANGFEHFDRSVDCRRPTCHSKRMTQHYHCTHSNCDYAFIRPTTMIQHARKHELSKARRFLETCNSEVRKVKSRPHPSWPVRLPSPVNMGKPPYLPLGMSPIVAAHLPSLFSVPQNGLTEPRNLIPSPYLTDHEQLPGFLPIWAAAMAAAAAVAKASSGTSNIQPNVTLSNLPPFCDMSSFATQDPTRSTLSSHGNEEEASVGV